ncbi:hypothetical protein [Clostridium sp. C2-6-12]|uniref:hypothetical protein n=1 Tax=Clostridium sp. C2-6-12 TaxID=2698832 RepID=UPI0013709D84|nr:hypothetical protein [Clostridium sp. C2-6-12]
MIFLIKQKEKIFIGLSITMLFIATFFNIALKTTDLEWAKDFDSFSNGIMIADMNYRENYPVSSYFQEVVFPGLVLKDGRKIESGQDVYDAYVNNEKYDREDYRIYNSSLTIHRYVYNFFNQISPFSKSTNITIFYMINALLLSVVLTIFINWLKNHTNIIIGYIILAMIACFSPSIAMYGINLYWISWSLFLPMVVSIFIVESKYFDTTNKKYFLPMILAFLTCMLKQLFYFEFISTTMIAMMIPYIFMCIYRKYKVREIVKVCAYPTIGAFMSFIVVSAIKFKLLIAEYSSVETAKTIFFDSIFRRLTGESDNVNPLVAMSAKAPYIEVIKIMGSYPAYYFKKVFSLSNFGVIGIIILISFYILYLFKKNKIEGNSKLVALTVSSLVSLLAPLSWFILAKPHTYIHRIHCTITWFIPFVPLATVLILYFIKILFTNNISIFGKSSEVK